jgi:hypothetical protein
MRKRQAGTTLVETLVAVAISTTVVFSLAALVTLATQQTKSGGQIITLTTTLASQKLDQLFNSTWNATTTATALVCASSPCGSLTTDTTGYVEYLDAGGAIKAGATSTTSPGVVFTRRWQVTNTSSTVKTITVRVDAFIVSSGGSSLVNTPTTTLATYKARQ